MELISSNFDSLKEQIEDTKRKYINPNCQKEEVKEMYLNQRNRMINYINNFENISKKDLIHNIHNSKTKEELKRNKKLLKEYKKINNNGFFVNSLINFDNINESLENDCKEIRFSMFLKLSSELVGLINIIMIIYFKYDILFFPFQNLLEYSITMILMYYMALFFDYTKESIREDINTLYNLKYTLKNENKTTVK